MRPMPSQTVVLGSKYPFCIVQLVVGDCCVTLLVKKVLTIESVKTVGCPSIS